MPAILPDEEAVSAWLNQDLHGFEALKVLQSLPGFEKKSAVSYLLISPIFTPKFKKKIRVSKIRLWSFSESSLLSKNKRKSKAQRI